MAKSKVLATAVYIDGKLLNAGDKVTAAQAKDLREGGWFDDRADLWEDGDEEPDDEPLTPPADRVPPEHPNAPAQPDSKAKK
jgi:hypothetical protein